jgi:hypothetical protein
MDPSLFPIVTALIALAGVALGAGLTWLGNRSNARVQIEGQRQLAADARRYERRREQVAPLRDFVRRRVAVITALITSADMHVFRQDFAAASAAYNKELLAGDYEAAQLRAVPALAAALATFRAAALALREELGRILEASAPQTAETWPQTVKEMRLALNPLLKAAALLEQAIDAYLDDLPHTTLAKRPEP